MDNYDKYKTNGRRPVWSYKIYREDFDKLNSQDAHWLRTGLAEHILKGKLNFHDKRFLKQLGYFVLDAKFFKDDYFLRKFVKATMYKVMQFNLSPESILNEVYFCINGNYFYTDITDGMAYFKVQHNYTSTLWERIFEDFRKRFFKATPEIDMLAWTNKYIKLTEYPSLMKCILTGDTPKKHINYKFKFKDKESVKNFIIEMAQVVEHSNVMTFKVLADRIYNYTETSLKRNTIFDYIKRYK